MRLKMPRVSYAYNIVAAGFVISLLMWGGHISFGIFFKPLSLELEWTRASISVAYSVSNIVFGLSSIVAGRLTDRLGPKAVLIASGCFVGLSYLLLSQINTIWQLYLFYGLILGVGLGGGDAPVLSTVARWFNKGRGLATGITMAGGGIGILVVPPVVSWLIYSYGWRGSFAILGLISLAGIILAALFLKRDPHEIRQSPLGMSHGKEKCADLVPHQFSLREAIITRQLWMLIGVWFTFSFCMQTIMVHTAPHITDLGISTTIAAFVIGTIGGLSLLGRLGMGYLIDLAGSKTVLTIYSLLLPISLSVLLFAREPWTFFVFAALYGIAHGTAFTIICPLVAEVFGLASLGAIYGVVSFFGVTGGAIGPVIAGRIFDITGSYQPSLLICLSLSVLSIVVAAGIKPTTPCILE